MNHLQKCTFHDFSVLQSFCISLKMYDDMFAMWITKKKISMDICGSDTWLREDAILTITRRASVVRLLKIFQIQETVFL